MNEYEQQALDFLIKTGTNLDVEFRYTGPVEWDTDGYHHDHYRVTLKRNGREFGFDFTDSRYNSVMRKVASELSPYGTHRLPADLFRTLHRVDPTTARMLDAPGRAKEIATFKQKWRNHQPTAYDVLAGLDAHECGSFDDFCADFGYNELPMSEYPRVMGVYAEVQRQSQELHRMFSEEELDMLREIS